MTFYSQHFVWSNTWKTTNKRTFEVREANGDPTDGHIYISVNKVRTELLLGFDITSSPEAEERARKWQEQLFETNIRQAWKEASANHPGARPDELVPEIRLALRHRGYHDVDMARVIDVLSRERPVIA